MSLARAIVIALSVGVMVGLTNLATAQDRNQNLGYLTTEEANRPAEEWTLKQLQDKGWTPYECFFDDGVQQRAPEGRRWPKNDPDPSLLGACVTYSFMPTGVALEMGPPPEGPNTWPGSMPVGSAAAFGTAATTWEGAADVHLTSVADGGGAWDVGGPTGLKGNIRVGAGTIARGGVLAHGYYPPPNGVSAAGDVHFDDGYFWVTSGAAAGPPFDVETVSLHELGHALGLDHMATVAGDVMFPAYTGIKTVLAPGDIAFMVSIYGPGGHVAQCSGACCFSKTVCGDRTQALCTSQSGTWRGAGTTCPTQNVRSAQHASGTVVHWVNAAMDCFTMVLRRGQTQGCLPGIAIDAWMSSEELTEQTCHSFGFTPESPAIPADFFGPGSEPFEGQVCLLGEPVGPTQFGEYGEADTLILRSSDPFDRCELPSPTQRTVDIEIVALNLISIAPIDVIFPGPVLTQWEVRVDLSQVPAPQGQMTAIKTHCNGGTYNSILPVQPRFTFTKVGGPSVVPDGTQAVLDTGLEGLSPIQLLQDTDPPWTHDVDPYLNLAGAGQDCSGFHPGIEDPSFNLDCDCNNTGIRDDCDIESGASSDCNANGIPDECDPDADGDGIPDDCDNCPDHPNPGQLDADNNGVGDLCRDPIPTVSEWGLLVMTVLLLAGGGLILSRRNSVRPTP